MRLCLVNVTCHIVLGKLTTNINAINCTFFTGGGIPLNGHEGEQHCLSSSPSCKMYGGHVSKRCQCQANRKTQLWSMIKMKWMPAPNLPKGFAFLTGCLLDYSQKYSILVGGHETFEHVVTPESAEDVKNMFVNVPITIPSNSRVIGYNNFDNKWIEFGPIPIEDASDIHFSCSVAIGKNHTRYKSTS